MILYFLKPVFHLRLQSNKQISTKRNNKIKNIAHKGNKRQMIKCAKRHHTYIFTAKTTQSSYYLSQKPLKAKFQLASLAFF